MNSVTNQEAYSIHQLVISFFFYFILFYLFFFSIFSSKGGHIITKTSLLMLRPHIKQPKIRGIEQTTIMYHLFLLFDICLM